MISYSKNELKQIIQDHSNFMIRIDGIQNDLFLLALAGIESSFGADNNKRLEKAYLPDGKYGQTDQVKLLYPQYLEDSACSFSPWQILFITAYSLGYRGAPRDLELAANAIPYVIKFFNHWISEGVNSVDGLARSWNGGNPRSKYVPEAYVNRLQSIYAELVELQIPA